MRAIVALALKDLRLLFRDKLGLFFALVFPILYAGFFGTMFSGGGGDKAEMKICVVDHDQSDLSRALRNLLDESKSLRVDDVPDVDTARNSVRKSRHVAFIEIPKGYEGGLGSAFFGKGLELGLGVDPARRAEQGMLQGLLLKCAYEQLRAAAGMDTKAESDPIRVSIEPVVVAKKGPRVKNAYAISFPQGIIWGIMGCAAAFGISLVVERAGGTLLRLQLAPIRRPHILAGKALACFLTTTTIATVLLAVARVFFDVVPQSITLLVFAVLSISVCFVGIMMLLSVLGRTEAAAGGIGWAVLLVMAMFGGGMIPLFVLPAWVQQVGSFSPVKWSILAMEGAIWRGFSWAEMLSTCGILVGIGVAAFGLGAGLFRRIQG